MPYPDSLIDTPRSWAEDALLHIRSGLKLMSPALRRFHPPTVHTRHIPMLASATARSTESALLLVAWGQLWDAEVLVRSVIEGTLKFCYILQTEATLDVRLEEYADALFDIAMLKDTAKRAEFFEVIPDPEAPEWRSIKEAMVSEAELERIRSKFSKIERRRLEAKWGFTGILGELANSGDDLFKPLPSLMHFYSNASHIQHADAVGVWMPIERDSRSVARRDALHLAHAARLISDTMTMFDLRLHIGRRLVLADPGELINYRTAAAALSEQLSLAADEWSDIEYGPKADWPERR